MEQSNETLQNYCHYIQIQSSKQIFINQTILFLYPYFNRSLIVSRFFIFSNFPYIFQQIKQVPNKMTHMNSIKDSQNYQEAFHNIALSQKVREVYISPFKQTKPQGTKQTYKTSPCKFIKYDHHAQADNLPPKSLPFRRSSKNSSKDKIDLSRQISGQLKYIHQINDPSHRHSANYESLQKKFYQQSSQRQKLKSLCLLQEQKIKHLQQLLAKAQQEKDFMNKQLTNYQQLYEKHQKEFAKANQQIQTLNKSLKECKINQKSLNNLKNIQNQLDILQQKNLKLSQENQQLAKSNKKMKNDLTKKKDSTSQSQPDSTKKEEKIKSLQLQVNRLKQQLSKDRTQRQIFLQSNLHELQRKLFQKQNQITKISIRLNYLDRKKYDCIDEIKNKKDQQIKDLRQRFIKVSKDLKETKNKFQLNQKKRTPSRSPMTRKIKSSTLLGAASQSQQVTFQFSSQA